MPEVQPSSAWQDSWSGGSPPPARLTHQGTSTTGGGGRLFSLTPNASFAQTPLARKLLERRLSRPWLEESLELLAFLRQLAPGWDSYSAEPPNELSVDWARATLEVLDELGVPPTCIVPSAEGGVSVCFVADKRYADIECFNTGEILAGLSGVGGPRVWEVAPNKEGIRLALDEIRGYLRA